MSALLVALEDYLALRRSLGFKLERAGKLLAQFVAHCEAAGAETVTIHLALGWATFPQGGDGGWAAYRLSVVRGFAKHLALLDKRTEVPPANLLPARSHRTTPYLYTEDEVRKLMAAAGTLRSASPSHVLDASRAALGDRDARWGDAPARSRRRRSHPRDPRRSRVEVRQVPRDPRA